MIRYHRDLIQGSDEWLEARCGMLTASEMKLIVTPTLKIAANDKQRAHLWDLLAQRITRYVEPSYFNDDMLRGQEDEIEAVALYERHYAPVDTTVGFITNDDIGFTLGCSPDGLVGDDGLIECKSRRQRFQAELIVTREIPPEHMIQLQTAMLVAGRSWVDYVSYCGGMPMVTIRVVPDEATVVAIRSAASAFEAALSLAVGQYGYGVVSLRTIPTTRRIEQEMHL